MNGRLTKDFAFDVENVTAEGVIEGYASVFGNIDSAGDIIAAGAFTRTIAAWRAKGRPIPVLWQHDAYDPIGVTDSITEDEHGLRVRARLVTSVQRARDAHALAEAGALGGLSIGFSVPKFASDGNPAVTPGETPGTTVYREVRLWEYSLVTFPANDLAVITSVKAEDPPAWAADLIVTLASVRDALRATDQARVLELIRDVRDQLGISRERSDRRGSMRDPALAGVLKEATQLLTMTERKSA